MPGVLLIETMAQASGYLVLATTRFERMPFLIGVEGAKLRTFVEPGTALTVEASFAHEGSGFAVTTARIAASEKRICDAELRFRLMPFPNADFVASMRAQAGRIGCRRLGAHERARRRRHRDRLVTSLGATARATFDALMSGARP